MQIDWNTLIAGIIIGAIIAFLLKLRALKRLDLNLKRIGLSLGVEGFEEKEKESGVTIGDVGGNVTGDIAGRDINKNSNFYQTIQAATRSAIKGEGGTHRIEKRVRFDWRSSDQVLSNRLRSLQQQGGNWVDKYFDECLQSQDFLSKLDTKVKELQRDGWGLMTIVPIDNTSNGLIVDIHVERPLRI